MVTLCFTTSFDSPLSTPVSPRRGPCERLMSGLGDFTMAEEMATMRPKPRSHMPGSTACTNRSGAIMERCAVSAHCCSLSVSNIAGVGPSPLSSTMSGAGQAASSASRPWAVVASATTPVTVTPWAARSSATAVSTSVALRPLMTTSAPSRAMLSAQARPRPRLEAIRMAERPAIPRSMVQSSPAASRAAPMASRSVGMKKVSGSFGPQTAKGA